MGKVSVSLAYSAELIASLSITLSVGTITISFLWSFEHMVNGYLDGDNNCVLAEPIYLLVTTAIYDIGFGVLLLCLFIKKLHSTHRDRSRLREVQHLITKNTALIVITYGCSAVLGAVSLFFFYPKGININSVDLIVNVVCVSLMKKATPKKKAAAKKKAPTKRKSSKKKKTATKSKRRKTGARR